MQSVHAFAFAWLLIILLTVLCRRILWINRFLGRLRIIFGPLECIPYLQQVSMKLFPQHEDMNLVFLVAVLVSNGSALVLYPGPSILAAVIDRIGTLIIINIGILFLLSFRHSLFIELAAGFQPEFLWCHQVLGILTTIEMAMYFGLEFREISRHWQILVATVSTGLLALSCLPAKRLQWELHHQTIWRKLHSTLTVMILAALGFALPTLPHHARPYYVCVVCFYLLEYAVGECRQTLHHVKFVEEGSYVLLRPENRARVPIVGVFYWIRGTPFPASWRDDANDTIRAPSDLLGALESDKAIRAEGPYGPGIGILSYMKYWVLRGLRAGFRFKNEPTFDRRPPQLISKRKFYFVVDQTAIARVFPLWLWLRSSSYPAKLYHCNLTDVDAYTVTVSRNAQTLCLASSMNDFVEIEFQDSIQLLLDKVKKWMLEKGQGEEFRQIADTLAEEGFGLGKDKRPHSRPMSNILGRLQPNPGTIPADDCVIAVGGNHQLVKYVQRALPDKVVVRI